MLAARGEWVESLPKGQRPGGVVAGMVVDSRVVARSVAWRQGGADRRRRRTVASA